MEIDASSLDPWQKGEVGGNHLGVIVSAEEPRQIGLQSQAQKLPRVSQ